MELDSTAVLASGRRESRWWRRLGRRSLVVGGVAVVMVAGGAGIGLASIPSGTGVFHGCYVKSGGALRLIDPSAHQQCKRGELAVSWNQAGQRGPAGPRGLKGAKGAKGAIGPTGPAGAPGLDFTTGTGANSPTLSTAGTYFVVVRVAIENDTPNAIVGNCGVGDGNSMFVIGFNQALVSGPGTGATESFSGVITVPQAAAPASLQVACNDDSSRLNTVPQAADPVWWVAKVPTS
jgi:hypothetical protein